MNIEKLEQLIRQVEGPTLDFKREWYRIDDPNGKTKKRHRNELIKDILSLANGNTISVGESSYIVIGVDDEFNENGDRKLYDIDDALPTSQRILQIVNAACEPSIENICCDLIELNGKRIFAITIPPSPHLHETTRSLSTPHGQIYSKHLVFVRHNEGIQIASAKEREAIQKLKTLHFTEQKNAPPILFGAALGAILGGSMAGGLAKKTSSQKEDEISAALAGVIAGGTFGGLAGNAYKDLSSIKSEWPYRSNHWRFALVAIIVASIAVLNFLVKQFKRRRESSPHQNKTQ
jgi:hypothetical protein